jgi:pSer/pThr/pTyr-binding forkhead associated (FHA) protein
MARLVLSLDGQVMAEYNMNKERYTIGRLPDNDIRIDNPAVSGHHSLIINILNDSFLEDLNSTNGTYVNGKLIKKHALQHGDVITVGHHQLRFVEDDEQQDEFEKTMVIQPSARPMEKLRSAADVADAVSPALSATGTRRALGDGANALRKAKLQVLSGAFAGRELELNKALTTLGRPGVQVAAITRRADGFFIVHVESKDSDYPLLNGNAIGSQATRLSDNDVIQLAGVKMGFFEG